jgi:antitoxin VapB
LRIFDPEAAMPLYVKDREVGELAERLARLRKTSKTEAVRQALRSELEQLQSGSRPEKDDQSIDLEAQSIMECAAEIRRKYPAGGKGLPVTKEWIDSLYED